MKVTLEEFLGIGENKMSKAKACDRCGKIYKVNRSDYMNLSMIIKYGYDFGKESLFNKIDICPDCVKDFKAFLRTNNTEHNEEVC